MRVLVTGDHTRTSYEDRMWLYAGLSLIHARKPITEIIEGGANGFDHHAKNWTLWRRACGDPITLTTINANWTLHGKAAGPIRNSEMAKLQPDVVLACPGNNGTQDMIDKAKKAELPLIYLEKLPVLRAKERPPEPEPEGSSA